MTEDIKKRIDRRFPHVSRNLYLDSILNVIEMLTYELEKKLKMEGRYMGMVKSYVHSIWQTITYINDEIDDETMDVFERTLYMYKKLIQREYTGLVTSRRLSQGDSAVVIILRLLEIVEEKMPDDYIYARKVLTLKKLITKFYDNIKNPKKKTSMFVLKDTIKEGLEKGKIGRHKVRKIELPDLRKEVEMLEVLEEPGPRAEFAEGEVKKVEL